MSLNQPDSPLDTGGDRADHERGDTISVGNISDSHVVAIRTRCHSKPSSGSERGKRST
jgi:hypothetical protein